MPPGAGAGRGESAEVTGPGESAATALDAPIFLGLVGKAEQVFSRDGHFLSFPLSLWGVDPDELAAAVNDPLSEEGVHGEAEFADLVNRIPTGVLWQPHQGTRLWDVHGDVLRADLAEGTRTPKDEAAYEEALSVLKVEQDGALVDSPTVVEYERCRDAYIAAVQEFNNRQSQAELSEDPDVTDRWENDRAALRKAVDEAADAWDTDGKRAVVEEARGTFLDIGSRSPAQVWESYREQFDPDLEEIFFKTGPQGIRYVPTGYIPADVVDSAWASMKLTHDDLATLGERAPEELRDRLDAQPLQDDVVSVALEYSTITPHRPWFERAPYTSRAWRFPDANRILSDGQSPPAGECPAYVTGLVLVRNIALERREREPEPVSEHSGRSRRSRPARRTSPTRASRRPRRPPVVDHRRESGAPEVRRRRSGVADVARRVAVRMRRAATRVRRSRSSSTVNVRDHRGKPPLSRSSSRRPARSVTRVRSRRGAVTPASPPPPTSERVGGDEIYILAFECWALPRCPDPDLNLVW